ncbi:DUF6252 family protein [Kordia sp.]|uniref:DUF6252 family protein n=1 Tax=Kordia sp. TaxID=1965332 RepID=UPI003B59400B
MKKTITNTILLLSLLFTIYSCSSDDNEENNTVAFRADIETAVFEGATVLAGISDEGRTLEIAALNADGTVSMSVNIESTQVITANTTYNVDEDGTYILYDTLEESYIVSLETGGSITITEIDSTNMTISGTFSGILKEFDTMDEKTLSNGTFTNLPYININ